MIKWTYKQIKLFRWKYIFYIGCIIVYTLISLLTPIIGKYIIDILIPNKQLKMLVGISCVWLVVECFRNSINIISENIYNLLKIIYVFLTIFLYLLKCPQSLILSALRAFCFCGKPHISRSIFLYFRYQAWLKSW